MMNANMIIANNISNLLKINGRKQSELAEAMNISRQKVSKMLSGERAINAMELKEIADFCGVAMEKLVAFPETPIDTDVVHAFMGKVKTEEAREGIRIADELIDLFIFHDRARKLAISRMAEWSSLV